MKTSLLLIAALFFLLVVVAHCEFDCQGQPNNNPIINEEPVLVKTIANGKKYTVGKGDDSIYLIHVYGTPYEWGKAAGELMREELQDMIPTYYRYLDEMIAHYIKYMPETWAKVVAEIGLDMALDLNYEITKKYTPQRFQDELNGLADGSMLNMKLFRRMNLLPELIKAGCSMYGAWSNSTTNGGLMQLRALDWDDQAPIKKYPTVTVYHPNDGSHVFANIGWPGLIGVITGYSDNNIGISEKVWLGAPSDYSSRFGSPWTYVLRDVLQYTSDLDAALNMLINTNRTCAIHIGVGDSKTGEFRGVEYSYKQLNIYDWMTQPVYDNHPQLPCKYKQYTHR
jgi:hypothetical protein